jgi:hypothetical protein
MNFELNIVVCVSTATVVLVFMECANMIYKCTSCDCDMPPEWKPSAGQMRTCIDCKAKYEREKHRRWRAKPENRTKENADKQIQRLKLKLETILAYGGKCVGCGETHSLFLVLDHINNNGHLEPKERGKGCDFMSFLRRMGYPGKDTQLQLLCHNCNSVKEYQGVRKENHIVKIETEIYVQQEYSLTQEIDEQLWKQAGELYNRIQSKLKERID